MTLKDGAERADGSGADLKVPRHEGGVVNVRWGGHQSWVLPTNGLEDVLQEAVRRWETTRRLAPYLPKYEFLTDDPLKTSNR